MGTRPLKSAGRIPLAGDRSIVAQLVHVVESGGTAFLGKPRPGHRRGIDFYSAAQLFRVIGMAADQFREVHGRDPDIVNPRLLSDKIFWAKFFRPMKVPETGNKLHTATFIPDGLRGSLTCPEIVWHSTTPRVPRNGEVEPGTYYLKASHGADMFRRVIYPIGDAEAKALDAEFAGHLTRRYGVSSGEWWYTSFQPELLLEKCIGTAENSMSWNYYVIGGQIPLQVVYQKTPKGTRKTYVTPDFKPLPGQQGARADYVEPSDAAKEMMFEAARVIGRPLSFVRVDFLLDDDERPYLGEVTFTPGSGLNRWSPELDLRLGRMWDLEADLQVQK